MSQNVEKQKNLVSFSAALCNMKLHWLHVACIMRVDAIQASTYSDTLVIRELGSNGWLLSIVKQQVSRYWTQ